MPVANPTHPAPSLNMIKACKAAGMPPLRHAKDAGAAEDV